MNQRHAFFSFGRISIAALALAAGITLTLQGSLLLGFEHLAHRGGAQAGTVVANTPTLVLEPVQVVARRA